MHCTKCGQIFEDDASFCPFCGERVVPGGAQSAASFDSVSAAPPYTGGNPYDAPQPGAQSAASFDSASAAPPYTGANPYDAPQPGVQSAGYRQAQGELTKPYLIPNILGIILCCSPVFIVGLVFSILANNKAREGNVQAANSKAQIAKILFWVGVGLGVLQTVLFCLFMALGLAAESF